MKPQLFLLHYAGGNCYSFQFLIPYLRDFDVYPLELPGRGKRITEPVLTSFSEAAQDIYGQLSAKLNGRRFYIYGHSMGSELAFMVSYLLEKAGTPPERLFLTGNPGPGIRENKYRFKMPYEEFAAELRKLGGVPEEFFENEELFEFYEPIIRSDFQIVEEKDVSLEIMIGSPITAIMGTDEEYRDDISNWSRFTRSDFECSLYEGDHFFIFDHPARLANVISNSIYR